MSTADSRNFECQDPCTALSYLKNSGLN